MKCKFFTSLLLLSVALWTGCSETTEIIEDAVKVPLAELEANAQAELISDHIDDIVGSVVVDESIAMKGESLNRLELPACATVIKTITEGVVTKKIDFGTGCEMTDGVTFSGVLWVVYTWDNESRQANIVLETEGFGVNDLAISGRKEIVRSWPAEGEDGFPHSSVETAMEVVHPDGLAVDVTGVTTRTWIAGYGSGNWGDNVVLIGGSRQLVSYLNGNKLSTYTMEITEDLRREWACRFIVSGTLSLSRGDFTATLNYGDGQCDNKAMLTLPSGVRQEINLR